MAHYTRKQVYRIIHSIAWRTVGELQSNPMRRWSKEYGCECCVCVSFHLTGHFRPGNGKRKRGDEVTHVYIKKERIQTSLSCAIENSPLDRWPQSNCDCRSLLKVYISYLLLLLAHASGVVLYKVTGIIILVKGPSPPFECWWVSLHFGM
jgi:hypothetical protein